MSSIKQNGHFSTVADDASSYLARILHIVQDHKLMDTAGGADSKVVDFVPPEELEKRLGGLVIGRNSAQKSELDDIAEKVVRYSVKTNCTRFYNQVMRKQTTNSIDILTMSLHSALSWSRRVWPRRQLALRRAQHQ